MKISSLAILALVATIIPSVKADGTPPPGMYILVNEEDQGGGCRADDEGGFHDWANKSGISTATECDNLCQQVDTSGLLGFSWSGRNDHCVCRYDNHMMPVDPPNCGGIFEYCSHDGEGTAPIELVDTSSNYDCYVYIRNTESNGDPHFRTWKNEHFEFHGQCDLVMTSVKDFGGQGIDLDIHIRTSMVRYWSYIKSVAIRIGNDILEVEGSVAKEDGEDKRHYRINYEYLGPLTNVGGFPVTISPRNNKYTIDLSSNFPDQKIEIKTFKEFVGVKIIGANNDSFGNAVGITGNFKTGETLARDGHTVLHDFDELGIEWQVLPSDGKLFHQMARPQFPELCYLPEDPRGERARRLEEASITEEAAEAACAGLKDGFDRKGCIYDIMATQDLDMVGAY